MARPLMVSGFSADLKYILVPFIKVREVHTLDGELIWDSKEVNLSNVRVIKGFDKKKND